ncbi:Immunity protein 7 [Lishizhenia tianjinensis]|uniref:Immunity protein 7 n=1 Tax=Lishizhenia tianjinensis TaxID=477690 RepID=A0A1I6XZP3_9FLAO|nr:Imm7 family immunity protein [Lishizhenia tianjinensis]SFT43636.1 Immunity protein 7 [Lishizhenia tianjinensis]
MIEYHGWITLRFSDYHVGNKKQEDFKNKLNTFLKTEFPVVLETNIKIGSFNGMDMLMMNGCHNHRGTDRFYPLQIFRWISENGPGSYGLLYIQDDEDRRKDYADNFRVWVLKRGQLEEKEDTLLSPYIPQCEKEFDEENPPIDYDSE